MAPNPHTLDVLAQVDFGQWLQDPDRVGAYMLLLTFAGLMYFGKLRRAAEFEEQKQDHQRELEACEARASEWKELALGQREITRDVVNIAKRRRPS